MEISDSFLEILRKRSFERIRGEAKLKGHNVYALEEAMNITIRTLLGMCKQTKAQGKVLGKDRFNKIAEPLDTDKND